MEWDCLLMFEFFALLYFQNENSSREYYIFLFCNCDENESYSEKNNIFNNLVVDDFFTKFLF